VRKGEWFFIPCPGFEPPAYLVRTNEVLGGTKPHVASCGHRAASETVHVRDRYPQGVTEKTYRNLLARAPGGQTGRQGQRQDGRFSVGSCGSPECHSGLRFVERETPAWETGLATSEKVYQKGSARRGESKKRRA
jgi:hypothetical protein